MIRRPLLLMLASLSMTTGVAVHAAATAGSAAPAGKVTLAAQDQKSLSASCGADGFDNATARSARGGGVAASVRCKTHGKEGDVPLARVTQCQKKSGAWKCAPARDALLLTMFDDSVLALVNDGVPAPEAIQAVNTVAGASVPPFQKGAIEVLQDQCSIRQLPERLFKGATHFKVECTAATLDVTRDCWDGRCRFFITNATRHD